MQYQTAKQLAEKLNVKPGTIRQWVARGKIKVEKVANVNLISKAEAERIIKEYR